MPERITRGRIIMIYSISNVVESIIIRIINIIMDDLFCLQEYDSETEPKYLFNDRGRASRELAAHSSLMLE